MLLFADAVTLDVALAFVVAVAVALTVALAVAFGFIGFRATIHTCSEIQWYHVRVNFKLPKLRFYTSKRWPMYYINKGRGGRCLTNK